MSLIVDGTTGVTFNDSSLQGAAASPYVLKNRIINGAMMIDQRNAGASVTPTDGQYTVDRWYAGLTQASKFSLQQSTDVPTGFTNSLKATSLSSYSVGTSDTFLIGQIIEGLNVYDLDWGSATAKTITLSFWVKSSLTGTFGGALKNSAANRSYVFSYTISSANTWEQKSVTIAGDTSGTWLKTNGIGIYVIFGIGGGSTFSGTTGSWTSSNLSQVTGGTSVVGTNGATFYITGVQLEIGSSATPFERRMYGQELINCQRYYWHTYGIGVTPGTSTINGARLINLSSTSTGSAAFTWTLPVAMRTAPTITAYSVSGTSGSNSTNGSYSTTGSTDRTILGTSASSSSFTINGASASLDGYYGMCHAVVSSEL